ncbi:hypothetical protein [Rhizobium rhizoryzae]|uniref:hypothetical protein n=1 Tax=Rhizobium rhizoryzae TaxID=451876 RepID=UPI0028A09D8C|nr:hypothetical protein [Rhizobium rhizoryzae]
MSTFLRLLNEKDKAARLLDTCGEVRRGAKNGSVFQVDPESFQSVPTAPFAYWVSDALREIFQTMPAVEAQHRSAKQGLATADDFRFVRIWWEPLSGSWSGFAKGGAFSPHYADIYLLVNWPANRTQIENNLNEKGEIRSNIWMLRDTATSFFGRPGITWPRRTQGGLSFRALPRGCIFADKGPSAFLDGDSPVELLSMLALVNSRAFGLLVSLQMAFGSYEVGVIKRTPIPNLNSHQHATLAALARRAWSSRRNLDTIQETSHAFLLPAALRARLGDYDPLVIEAEMADILSEIENIAFDLYGFSNADRAVVLGSSELVGCDDSESVEDVDVREEDDLAEPVNMTDGLLSWAIGVAFGRFDWRLATGEREAPPEPDPFDPLPAKSPGMLPDGATPFHDHSGILVDDQGHPHDLARLIEEVLTRVQTDVPADVRRWLQRDFFPLHLKQYSKSRRKAPIYWPLSTISGSYTLWLYYPHLTSQTLYTAVNDFVEPKLKQVSRDAAILRDKGAGRTCDDEKAFEALQALELELIELRDTLLDIAPTYRPNHDDGVQITAAPLWPLFRHKPWQKVLKDTWAKLEKGDYDWSHLAMTNWPDRVREKCKTDKSLAIAHDLEDLYEPVPSTEGSKKKKKGSGA